MKTLLRKITIALAAMLLCITMLHAQIPGRLKNLPPFKSQASMHEWLSRHHAAGKFNPIRCSSNAPCIKEQTTLGGSGYDQMSTMSKTRDGGFVVCGLTASYDGDFHAADTIGGDAFLAKYSRFGKLEWTKTFGGTGFDFFNNVIQTYDGSYLAVGATNSNDGDVSGNHGGVDVLVVKFSASGNVEWQKCFGGSGDEYGDAIMQTFYGGYAVSGTTSSDDGDVSGNHNTDGNFDAWFIQLGLKGKLLFQHCYGGSDYEEFYDMVPSGFGNIILSGPTASNDGDVSGNHGGQDAWVVKLNAFGKILWQRAVGGSSDDGFGPGSNNEITKANDGNVIIDGGSNSSDGDIPAQPQDSLVSFLAKLNAETGSIIWSKAFKTPTYRYGSSVFSTRDGGVVEVGTLLPIFYDFPLFDCLVSKFDKNGNEEWYKNFGGDDYDAGKSGFETDNGDLVILSQTESGDIKNYHGNDDGWIIKLGSCGNYIADNATSTDDASASSKITTTNLSAYPNPISNLATISFNLQQSQKVVVTIYDMNGTLIKTLANTQMEHGNHQLIWNARDEKGSPVTGGIYLLKLQAGDYSETKKMSVVH